MLKYTTTILFILCFITQINSQNDKPNNGKESKLEKTNESTQKKDSIDYYKKFSSDLLKEKEYRQLSVNQRKKVNDSMNIIMPKKIIFKDTIDYYKKFSEDLFKTKEDRIAIVNHKKNVFDSLNKQKLEEIRNKKANPQLKVSKAESKKDISIVEENKEIIVTLDEKTNDEKVEVVEISESSSFKSIFEAGKQQLEGEDYEKALEYFNECIKRKYYDVYSIYFKGLTLRKMKRYDEAIQTFRDLFNLDKTYFVTYFEIGKIHIEKAEYNHALYNFNQYLAQNPHSHEAHYYKALIYFETKKEKQALDEIIKAININDTNADFYVLSARIRLALKSNNAACADFQKALSIKSDLTINEFNDNCLKNVK